jgi:hypothetical protein
LPLFNSTIFNEDIFADGNPNNYDKVYNVAGFNDSIFNTTTVSIGSGRGGISKVFNVGFNSGTGFNDRVYNTVVDGSPIFNSAIFNNTMFNADESSAGGTTIINNITNIISTGRTLNKVRTMDK